ncbi:MAG TPA: heme-binding domain-containing protein [Ferruginibacter sp.]|nr:heme-binding domain-containing protein [Ferruginibacter sp.]
MFKKILKRTLIVLLIVFIAIQFIRPERNISDKPMPDHINKVYVVPEEVGKILKSSCYDCHSYNTYYPWYAEIQPVRWWLDEHIIDGKGDLNFDEFGTYSIRKQYRKMEEINDLVKKDEMPIPSYLWTHSEAKLSDQQKQLISGWVTAVRDTIKANYPPDSLLKKKIIP